MRNQLLHQHFLSVFTTLLDSLKEKGMILKATDQTGYKLLAGTLSEFGYMNFNVLSHIPLTVFYIHKTATAGFIVRICMDFIEMFPSTFKEEIPFPDISKREVFKDEDHFLETILALLKDKSLI